jgi:mono/diheme cytochrome c family protein
LGLVLGQTLTMRLLILLLTLAVTVPAFAADSEPPPETPATPATDPEAVAPADTEPAVVTTWTADKPVYEVRWALGEARPIHWVEPNPEKVKLGYEMTTVGRAVGPDGKLNKKQSRGFECTDCHNLAVEDPDLRHSDPTARFTYAEANDLPFLMATTLYGIVDRESWFNDDYVKKYGDFVKPANEKLTEALQLCSTECSQGRVLEDWELEVYLAYFWSIALKWSNLPAEGISLEAAELASRGSDEDKAEALAAVKEKYLLKSPATFGEPPEKHGKDDPGYDEVGDPAMGRAIFGRSCLHCHARGGPGRYRMSHSRYKARQLIRNMPKDNKWSFYESIRHGTEPWGRPSYYMPLFSMEKMTNQQIQDIRAYLEERTGRKK